MKRNTNVKRHISSGALAAIQAHQAARASEFKQQTNTQRILGDSTPLLPRFETPAEEFDTRHAIASDLPEKYESSSIGVMGV